MEPWEIDHIQKNKFDLQQFTTCNASFRAVLLERGVLGDNDISQLDAVQNSKGTHSECELLYNLLLTRKGAFNALIDACKRTEQTGALDILLQARIEHIKSHVTTWDDLSDDLKNEMGNRFVWFQGGEVKLSKCCSHLHHLIDETFLRELVKENIPTLVKNQVPDQVEYYIQRTLRSRSKLKISVFQQPCEDVFIFEGMEKHELTSLVEGANTDVSGKQLEFLSVRFILLEYEGDFETICKLTSSPVHLIKYKDSIYEWVKSSGSVKNLQKYVDDSQDCITDRKLARKGNRVNIIPDSPGMGKTVLLGKIGHHIRRKKPKTLIRFLVMKKLVEALNKKEITLEDVVAFIAKQSSEFECGQEMVRHILTSEPCVLMFDGFDEVQLHQVPTAKKILLAIANLKSAQIFITTRPHMREELENTLHALGYTIDPFTEKDRVEFLFKFWQMEGATGNDILKQFAKYCVNTISLNMTRFERDIAGIPLQCWLLAKTYTTQAIRCSVMGVLDINSQPIGQINSIFEMYERQIRMRFNLLNGESQIEAIKNVHMYYALNLMFREHAHQFQELKTTFSLNELCSVGFLEATNLENIRFVHHTFAEFFVAWFAVEMKISDKIVPFLLNQLLATKSEKELITTTTPFGKADLGPSFTFKHPIIAYFINGFSKMFSENYRNQDQSDRLSMLMDSVFYKEVSRIFVASAISDYQFVPLTVTLCFDPLKVREKGDNNICELLLISAKHSSVPLMSSFCAQRDLTNLKSHSKFDSFVFTPLHVAVQCGNYHLVAFLFWQYKPQLKNLRFLLHFCVFESLIEKEELINEKVQIVKLLSRENNAWLDEKLDDGTVPFLQKNVHNKLIKCLIECGADVNLFDKDKNTILHKITENHVTPEFYHELVVSLSKRKFKHFKNLNLKPASALHCAVRQIDLLPNTLEYFHSNGTDFNDQNEDEETPLCYAIRGGRSVELIRSLIKFGSNWKNKNKRRMSVLHICAHHGHHRAMKYFLETFKMDINEEDKEGNTPLHLAVMRRSRSFELTQRLLVTSGANLNTILHNRELKKGSENPFRKALKLGKGLTSSIIKLMVKNGLSINADEASEALKDLLSNMNIASTEIDKEFVQVLEFLISKGAEIKDIHTYNSSGKYMDINIWKSEDVQRNLPAIVKATDMSCLWDLVKTYGLLTESALEDIQSLSTDSFNKCERLFEAVQNKKGSFERVCILLITSNQMFSFSLLRQSLNFAMQSYVKMFVTPPTFTDQFIHSPQNSNLNIMALKTSNPFLTIWRIRDTISESVSVIEEADISSQLQNTVYEDLVVVKVRIVTDQLITKLEETGATNCKIILVCSGLAVDLDNFHVRTDTLEKWDDISRNYLSTSVHFNLCYYTYSCPPMPNLFNSPLILSKISQQQWNVGVLKHAYFVLKFKVGHIDSEFLSKNYLCDTIFHYILPDKLVFKGITIKQLKQYARFGHKIGNFGEDDVENLDFVVVEHSHQFEKICNLTSENVHLVEYEKGVFNLVRTWGWEENIQWYLKKPICEEFPHCECAPASENVVVRLLIETKDKWTVRRFECMLPIHELTPLAVRSMKLEDAEELFNIRVLLKRLVGQPEAVTTDIRLKSHSEQIVTLVTNELSTFPVESELHQVAINTLFPDLVKHTEILSSFEKLQQLGMLKHADNNQMVFVHQSLAWYFIANLLMGLTETQEFEGTMMSTLRKELFQNLFELQEIQISTEYDEQISSYEFKNIMFFRFVDALQKKHSDKCGKANASISNFLKRITATEPEGCNWIHACVNANLLHFLQLIKSLNVNAFSSAFQSEELVVLAVNHADVPITQLVAEQFEQKTKRRLTEIKPKSVSFSIVHLAALRGHYGLVHYLLNNHGFTDHLLTNDKLLEVIQFSLRETVHNLGYEIDERKSIVELLLRTDITSVKDIKLFSWNIHVDLIVYLINLGVDVHAKDTNNKNVLHICPLYLTPKEYHTVVKLIHDKDKGSLGKLFHKIYFYGQTAFHVAVEHVELLDETLALFSEAGVNFNALNRNNDTVVVHAAKHFRSACLLDTLYRFGAGIHGRDDGEPAFVNKQLSYKIVMTIRRH